MGPNPVRVIVIVYDKIQVSAYYMEDYPSPAEGNGLENRQAGKTVQGFESLPLFILLWISYYIIAGWSSWQLVGLITRRS